MTEVVNFKCNPILIGSLLAQLGILPAYHLNKEERLTVYWAAAYRTRKGRCCWIL